MKTKTFWIVVDSFGRDSFSSAGTVHLVAQDAAMLRTTKRAEEEGARHGEFPPYIDVPQAAFDALARKIAGGAYYSDPANGKSGKHLLVEVELPESPFAETHWSAYV